MKIGKTVRLRAVRLTVVEVAGMLEALKNAKALSHLDGRQRQDLSRGVPREGHRQIQDPNDRQCDRPQPDGGSAGRGTDEPDALGAADPVASLGGGGESHGSSPAELATPVAQAITAAVGRLVRETRQLRALEGRRGA